MELHVKITDGSGVEVGTVHLAPERRWQRETEYLMTVSVDRGPTVGMYRQTVVIEHDANPVGMLLAALLFLNPEHRVMDGEIVDSSDDGPSPGPRYELGGPAALER